MTVGSPTSPVAHRPRAEELAHQGLQRPGHRPVDQLGEQRGQRVGQLLHDARPHVDRGRVGHRPVGRRRGRGLGQRRHRAGLDDRERAARASPLDVLRRAEPLLDPHAEGGEGGELGVVEHRARALRRRDGTLRGAAARGDGHHRLVRGGARPDAPGRLLDHRVVGGHRPAHHRLAEPPRGGDHDLVAAAGRGVRGEQDARGVGPPFATDHLLHDDGQRDLRRVDLAPGPVGHRPGGPQRRPAVADGGEQRIVAADVEERVLLAGEARALEVLGGRRGPDGDGRRPARRGRRAARRRCRPGPARRRTARGSGAPARRRRPVRRRVGRSASRSTSSPMPATNAR